MFYSAFCCKLLVANSFPMAEFCPFFFELTFKISNFVATTVAFYGYLCVIYR